MKNIRSYSKSAFRNYQTQEIYQIDYKFLLSLQGFEEILDASEKRYQFELYFHKIPKSLGEHHKNQVLPWQELSDRWTEIFAKERTWLVAYYRVKDDQDSIADE